ncbi:MAG: hypothetical protein ABIH41_03120, partial [Nanoarchaeota archaeon]
TGFFGAGLTMDDRNIVIGELNGISGGTAGGAAYLYDATTYALITTIPYPQPQQDGKFGDAITLTDDHIYISAPWQDVGGIADTGTIYVFDRTGIYLGAIQNPDPHPGTPTSGGDAFGAALKTWGEDIIVGTPYADHDGKLDAGRIYLIEGYGSADTTPPNITDVTITTRTTSSFGVGWMTDEPATTVLRYAKPGTAWQTITDNTLTMSHYALVNGLPSGTTYDYIVSSTDAANNTATSTTMTTSTLSPTTRSGGKPIANFAGMAGAATGADPLASFSVAAMVTLAITLMLHMRRQRR